MLKLLWAWATVSFSTHPECLKAPFTSIWSFETFTSSEFSQLMLQQLRQVYTKSCNYKIANNLDYVQTSRCVHIHYVQTRHCVHIHYVQTSTFNIKSSWRRWIFHIICDRHHHQSGFIITEFTIITQSKRNQSKNLSSPLCHRHCY